MYLGVDKRALALHPVVPPLALVSPLVAEDHLAFALPHVVSETTCVAAPV